MDAPVIADYNVSVSRRSACQPASLLPGMILGSPAQSGRCPLPVSLAHHKADTATAQSMPVVGLVRLPAAWSASAAPDQRQDQTAARRGFRLSLGCSRPCPT